jgi:hypothetical protein
MLAQSDSIMRRALYLIDDNLLMLQLSICFQLQSLDPKDSYVHVLHLL